MNREKKASKWVIGAALVGLTLTTTPAFAQKLVIGCATVERYNSFEVEMMLDEARTTVGQREANSLYGKYVGLKDACASNQRASRIVNISVAMSHLLSKYGVNASAYASAHN